MYKKKKNAIILIPGLMGITERDFSFLMPLLKKKFEIFRFDFPGFGKHSVQIPKIQSITSLLKGIKKFIIKNKISHPIIFGYCFGGEIALLFASKYPELVKSIIVYGTKVFYRAADARKSCRLYNLTRIQRDNPKWFVRLHEDHGKNLERVSNFSKTLALQACDLLNTKILKAIMIPTLFIYGIKDDFADPREIKKLKKLNKKNFSFYVIKKGAHNTFYLNPHKILTIIEKINFL